MTIVCSRFLRIFLFLSLCVFFSGCGGGSSNNENNASWTGTRQLGVAGVDTKANGIALDARGNVYVAGITYGGLDGNTLTKKKGTDLFFRSGRINGVRDHFLTENPGTPY